MGESINPWEDRADVTMYEGSSSIDDFEALVCINFKKVPPVIMYDCLGTFLRTFHDNNLVVRGSVAIIRGDFYVLEGHYKLRNLESSSREYLTLMSDQGDYLRVSVRENNPFFATQVMGKKNLESLSLMRRIKNKMRSKSQLVVSNVFLSIPRNPKKFQRELGLNFMAFYDCYLFDYGNYAH